MSQKHNLFNFIIFNFPLQTSDLTLLLHVKENKHLEEKNQTMNCSSNSRINHTKLTLKVNRFI